MSAEQSRAFLEFSKDDRLGPLFAAALSTGMRQGELFGLGWEDIDFERNTVRVRRALQRVKGKPTFVEPKSESSRRTITLPAVAMAAFRMQRTRQLEQRLLAGDQWQDWGLVFSSSKGTPLDGPNVNKRLQKLLEQAGLPVNGSTTCGMDAPVSCLPRACRRAPSWACWVTPRFR